MISNCSKKVHLIAQKNITLQRYLDYIRNRHKVALYARLFGDWQECTLTSRGRQPEFCQGLHEC